MLVRSARDIGKLVKAARKAQGWTQTQLADKIGTHQWWVSHLENGRASTELGMVLRALKTLGVSLTARLPSDSKSHAGKSLIHDIADRGKP